MTSNRRNSPRYDDFEHPVKADSDVCHNEGQSEASKPTSEPLWQTCPKCIEHYFAEPLLTHAFASVGIEHGKSSFQMAESYFQGYHDGGHKAAR